MHVEEELSPDRQAGIWGLVFLGFRGTRGGRLLIDKEEREPWGHEKAFMACQLNRKIGSFLLLLGEEMGHRMTSDMFVSSLLGMLFSVHPTVTPVLSMKENEHIQVGIHFTVKLLACLLK